MRRLDARTCRRWGAIHAEYGEPVKDVIQGLRQQGATWRTVAGALDISQPTLLSWRHKLALPVDGKVQWDALSYEDFHDR